MTHPNKFTATRFARSKRWFTLSIVSSVLLSMIVMGFALYETNIISFGSETSSTELHEVIAENEDLVNYLYEQKENEAHFITIANLIKEDQQDQLTESLFLVGIPLLILAGLLGYMLATRLFRPVEESFKSQERFIQDAAHELRNPLAALSTVVQNSKTNPPKDKAEMGRILDTMNRQIKQLISINEDLLFLERPYKPYQNGENNLSELLLDVVEDMQSFANKRKLKIETDITENIRRKVKDEDFIRLSRNLIENALKYGKRPSSKKITILLKERSGKARLVVQDYGIGIPKDELKHITKRFYRAKNASNASGSGLGLSIVTKIVESYDGEINFSSTKGKGTIVEVDI